jgi:hypothetical protein
MACQKELSVLASRERPASRFFDTGNLLEATGPANSNGVGRESSFEVQPRADLDDLAILGDEKRLVTQKLRLECFREQPPQNRQLAGNERRGNFDIEAVLTAFA